jgi:hypothetical protein
LPLFINDDNWQQQILSPLSFHGGLFSAVTNAGLCFGAILLDGMPLECPRTRSVTKMYLILKCEGVGTQDFCSRVIAKGGCFCTRMDCSYSSHHNKAWDGNRLKPGFYIVNLMAQKAFLEPFLLLVDGLWSRSGRSVLLDGEQTMESWAVVFRHLCNASNTNNEAKGTKEGEEVYFTEAVDDGLQPFTTAMKTPGGRGVQNPLMSPKRIRLEEAYNEEASLVSLSSLPQGPRVTALKHTLALVKGELGTWSTEAPYNTLHGGIQGLWTGLGNMEEGYIKQGETLRACQDRVDHLFTDTRAAWGKSNEAIRAVEQLANMGGHLKVSLLESQLALMTAKVSQLETTLNKATSSVMDLSIYVLSLPPPHTGVAASLGATVPLEEFLAFKEAHAQSLAAIWQDLKGGAVVVGGVTFDGEEACVAFACAHMPREPTYHCVLSLMFTMCMPSDEVIYKSDMQGGEIHMAQTSRNPIQSAVILSVNSTIPAILEGPKDSIQETK